MTEKFCLKWNDFETNVSKSFGLLRNEDYLHDVTLVCDDNKKISAHKLVLSACSEFFKSLFKNNKHPNPLICLEGISSKELQDILDYMYNGETNIFQEGLDKFLSVAQRFKIMGLLQKKEDDSKNPGTLYQTNQEYTLDESVRKDEATEALNESFELPSNYLADNPIERHVTRNSNRSISLNADDVNNINQQADELIETLPDGSLKCTLCGKLHSKGSKGRRKHDMRSHAETHLVGLSFDCQLCGKTFRTRNSFKVHQSISHKY